MIGPILTMLVLLSISLIGYECGYRNGVDHSEHEATQKALTALIQSHKCELLKK